jgi:hypothetical protein
MPNVHEKLNSGLRSKSSIQQEEEPFTSNLVKCYIWCIALYGAETWTLRKTEQKYLESFVNGAGEGWRRSVGPIM